MNANKHQGRNITELRWKTEKVEFEVERKINSKEANQ